MIRSKNLFGLLAWEVHFPQANEPGNVTKKILDFLNHQDQEGPISSGVGGRDPHRQAIDPSLIY